MNSPWSRSRLVDVALVLVLVAIAVVAVRLIGTLRAHQVMTQDLAELNDVKYGLLNANAWVRQVTVILEKKINEFEVTPENRNAVKLTLQQLLDALITEVDAYMRKRSTGGNFWTRAKQGVRDAFVDLNEVRAGIPVYADRILDEMAKPETRSQISGLLKELLSDLSRSTFAKLDQSRIKAIHATYRCRQRASCQRVIQKRIDTNHVWAVQQTWTLLVLTLVLFAGAWMTPGGASNLRLGLLTLCSGVLMLCGVLTPMIEVEARISELRFVLLGQPVVFTDQVLYFQSKSVLDVVHVLTSTGKPDMILVGGLIMLFSVVFPLAKLAASFVYLYDLRGLRQAAVMQFFALKSGKWSMADVFVVAIFMAYIGFNGLIASQLSTFASAGATGVDVLTTNGTSLQIGFFMFLVFCLASLLTSTMIDSAIGQKTPAPVHPAPERV